MIKYLLIGFFGAFLLIFLSKIVMSKALHRSENYYDSYDGKEENRD